MLEKLQRIGFSRKESEIYLALAQGGNMSANDIAKRTSTNRTVCYNVLQQLVDRGVVSYSKKDSKRMFLVANPKSLLADIKEQEEVARGLVQEIESISVEKNEEQSVEVFEGSNGLKQIFNEIRECKELYVLNATGLIFEHLRFSASHIIDDINKRKNIHIIGTQSMKKTQLALTLKAKIKYLPSSAENYATTLIFDGKVIIQTLKSKPFMVKISDRSIYEGYKKDFSVLWQAL